MSRLAFVVIDFGSAQERELSPLAHDGALSARMMVVTP